MCEGRYPVEVSPGGTTKKRIRTAKYQFAEKVAAGPLRALAHAVASL